VGKEQAVDSQAALESRIRAAEAEAKGIDLKALAASVADATVAELAPKKVRDDRMRFLTLKLGDAAQAEVEFERVLAGNELQPVNYLENGAIAARAICRITMRDAQGRHRGYGSGFLIAPGVLITNNHVLPEAGWASLSFAEFDYALDYHGDPMTTQLFRFSPQRLFSTSVPLDFSVVAVEPMSQGGGTALDSFGILPMIAQVGKVMEGEWLTIIQHPGGDRKAVCVRENRFMKRTDDVLWYSTDTMGGSSGSPVFNNDWQVVALHHAGVPERDAEGRILTLDGQPYVDGRDSDERIKWIANAGIRISRIVETLRESLGDHPLLQPIFVANVAPASGVITVDSMPPLVTAAPPEPPVPPAPQPPAAQQPPQPQPPAATDGTVDMPRSSSQPRESVAESFADFDAPLAADYASRGGYDPAFLGNGLSVPLPMLSRALKAEAAKLTAAPGGIELRYLGYSAIQHARRRLPMLTAANIDFSGRFAMRRPRDRWLIDPRIPADQQLGEFYYAKNQFDRGHMTRREDMEYGATRQEALERATDTMHFTNCAPQHSRFNQAKDTWQGLEMHLLEDSILRTDFRAMLLTGPVLAADDPSWDRFPDIAYPRLFWKVAVARTADGAPFAAAFLLDQSDAIARFGIEAAGPFEPFKTFQVPVKEVERLTGLTFRLSLNGKTFTLSRFDPLAKKLPPRGPLIGTESTAVDAATGYVPLWSVRAMIRPQ